MNDINVTETHRFAWIAIISFRSRTPIDALREQTRSFTISTSLNKASLTDISEDTHVNTWLSRSTHISRKTNRTL